MGDSLDNSSVEVTGNGILFRCELLGCCIEGVGDLLTFLLVNQPSQIQVISLCLHNAESTCISLFLNQVSYNGANHSIHDPHKHSQVPD